MADAKSSGDKSSGGKSSGGTSSGCAESSGGKSSGCAKSSGRGQDEEAEIEEEPQTRGRTAFREARWQDLLSDSEPMFEKREEKVDGPNEPTYRTICGKRCELVHVEHISEQEWDALRVVGSQPLTVSAQMKPRVEPKTGFYVLLEVMGTNYRVEPGYPYRTLFKVSTWNERPEF